MLKVFFRQEDIESPSLKKDEANTESILLEKLFGKPSGKEKQH